MPRGVPTAALAEMYSSEGVDTEYLVLLTVTHPDLGTPVRLVNRGANLTSRGNVFTAYPFAPVFEPQREGEMPRAQLVLDNVDRSLVTTLRTIQGEATIVMEVVREPAPDTVISSTEFLLTDAVIERFAIRADLGPEEMLDEPYGVILSPLDFPAAFRRGVL